MITIEERAGEADTRIDNFARTLRVAMPGIVSAVNSTKQTVSVRPAIREKLATIDGTPEWVEIPELQEVPLFVYRGGDYALTLPVSVGDECLVIFADMCIDAWWQSGGVQNQIERRRHDLSDAFAIVGFTSQVKRLSGYSGTTAQLRTLDGGSYIELAGGTINLVGNVNISGTLDVSKSTTINSTLTTTGNANINGISISEHTHGGVQTGGGRTGGPR